MTDASLVWSGDLSVSSTGDISVVDGPDLTQQRVLRRLLTNKNDYIWQPTYGGGLGQYVGQPENELVIEGTIRKQMFSEAAIASQPEPIVSTDYYTDGSVIVSITFVDAPSKTSQTLTFAVGV